MATVLLLNNINIPTGGGTFNLSTSSSTEVYKIAPVGGAVTLSANVVIQPNGTLVNGLYYKFEHLGGITPNGNTFTYMGEFMPDEMISKKCIVECYYTGSTWNVFFQPEPRESNILLPNTLVYHPYTLVKCDNVAVTSTASGSNETLKTTGNLLATTTLPIRKVKITSTGTTGAGANAKAISLVTTAGASPTQTLITNTVTTTPTSKDWKIEAFIIFGNSDSTYAYGDITFNGVAPEIKINTNTTAYDILVTDLNIALIANSSGGGAHTVTCQSFIVEVFTELL